MTESEFRVNLLKEYASLSQRVSALESFMKTSENQNKDLRAEITASLTSFRGTMRWGIGILVTVMLAIFAYMVADIKSHEALDAHPEAKANMADVQAKLEGQEKTTERIVRVVEKNNDMLMQMKGMNGREN